MATGSNTPPTDSTDLLVTMQHKSGTALIWRDIVLTKIYIMDSVLTALGGLVVTTIMSTCGLCGRHHR